MDRSGGGGTGESIESSMVLVLLRAPIRGKDGWDVVFRHCYNHGPTG